MDAHTQVPARAYAKRIDERRLRRAAKAIVDAYSRLARDASHLLAPILDGAPPRQWQHYPAEDAIDCTRRYQWYYHSHDPQDRAGSGEHGHFHLFARLEGVANELDEKTERAFLRKLGTRRRCASTRHLLAISMNAVGVPISLFTVNRWVTGDLPLSGAATLQLLRRMRLSTDHPLIDSILTAVIRLHDPEIEALIAERDRSLFARAARGPSALDDETLEVTSSVAIDVDRRLVEVGRGRTRPGVRPARRR